MIPHHDLDSSMRELFGDISLADPAFYKSGPIDVLLGVDLTLPLLKGQTLSLGKDKAFAIRSELGWIIGGKANSSGQNSFHVNHIQLVSDQLINKFWELDSVPCTKPLTSLEEEGCGSPVVKVSNHGRHVMSSILVPLKTRRVGQRCTLNLSRAETSSRWCGVVVRRGGCQLRCRPRHLTMVQNYVVRRQKPSCS
ncbi:DUF1758 domain-containing protein [Trichonephila clavipes]|nr:DUF1758 domain-containing protein [Trichonephila clavipes]